MVWRDCLYVGGSFTQAGSTAASRLAQWDGHEWHEVGGGVSGTGRVSVTELAVGADGLYVAGRFTRAGALAATNIARWDGTNWHSLGEGWPGPIYALAVHGNTVFVGGRFTNAVAQVVHLQRWDGQSWSSLGSGIGDARGTNFAGLFPRVAALLATDDSLFVGGIFASAGGKPSAGIARWVGHPRLQFMKRGTDQNIVRDLQPAGDPGLNWRWETSTDLRTWIPVEDDEHVSRNFDRRVDPHSPARFFRGVVTP